MEVANGNDGALAEGITVAATMHSFVCTQKNSRLGIDRAHIVLNNSPQENVMSGIRYRWFPSWERFPVKHSVLYKYISATFVLLLFRFHIFCFH